ncbi:hypothetical protein [Roseovarius sp. EL26]|uniref:hypothetical protein n=1 Tax=Roseovarius sp. EL26 TaxID=2126672 RepID=UPI000EA3F3B7|nr:hypothetical protein [Roseovarius sp. EL26]
MKVRRRIVLTQLAAGAAVAAGGATLVLRQHQTPRRIPFLTDEHLQQIAMPKVGAPRVLFVGNSTTLQHDVPGRVAALAAPDGRDLRTATAAARGAWLVETMRLDALQTIMRPGLWDAVVLQDFSKVPLNKMYRMGSARAMSVLAKRVGTIPVVFFPPWPARADNTVYHDAGRFAFTPENPADYAAKTMDHYTQVAGRIGATVAPVPEQWLMQVANGASLYAQDGHHSNAAGANLAAQVIWQSLRRLL